MTEPIFTSLILNWVPNDLNDNEFYKVRQFTWLLDKNWKEIYEGDIVKIIVEKFWDGFEEWVSSVEWNDRYASFGAKPFRIDDESPNVIEVIWNIYENPELLTK